MTVRNQEIQLVHPENLKMVKEANKIVKILGKDITFKQTIVKNEADGNDKGRAVTMMNQLGSNSKKSLDEIVIQVEDRAKNMTLMWTEFEFEEKLEMMREALRLYEDHLQNMQNEETKKADENREY